MQVNHYISELVTIIKQLELNNRQGAIVDFEQGVREIIALFRGLIWADKKLLFIGNGGSAAIASHMAVDFWKNAGIPSLCFNDGAQLTCLGNDYGYEKVFARPILVFARPGDILVAISSSGQSGNILKGAEAALSLNCKIITLSGFSPHNPLRSLGDFNFYCASQEYGFVELAHQMVLHMILDFISVESQGKLHEG